jgi:hypothetical protein
MFLTFQFSNLISVFPLPTSFQRTCPSSRLCEVFRNMLGFYGEEMLAPRFPPSRRTTPCRLSVTDYSQLPSIFVGRDNVVGIATRYGLDDPGIESRCGRDFSQPSRPALVPTQPPIHGYRVSFPGIKRPGRGVNHPHSSSAGVKERVELYLYSPSGPSWSVLGRTLLYLTLYIHRPSPASAN